MDAVIAQNPLQQRNIPLPPYTTQLMPQIDPSVPQPVFTITEKAPTRAISWLNAPTSAFTFKTLLRHYAKQTLTPQVANAIIMRALS